MTRTETVYFARESRGGLVKIGRSTNVPARIKQLSRDEKCNVVLLATCPVAFELLIHDVLVAQRVRGEWFKVTPEQIGAAIAYGIQQYFIREAAGDDTTQLLERSGVLRIETLMALNPVSA